MGKSAMIADPCRAHDDPARRNLRTSDRIAIVWAGEKEETGRGTHMVSENEVACKHTVQTNRYSEPRRPLRDTASHRARGRRRWKTYRKTHRGGDEGRRKNRKGGGVPGEPPIHRSYLTKGRDGKGIGARRRNSLRSHLRCTLKRRSTGKAQGSRNGAPRFFLHWPLTWSAREPISRKNPRHKRAKGDIWNSNKRK